MSEEVEHLPVEVVNEPRAVAVRTANALDMKTKDFVAALERRKANRRALMEWIKESLKAGQDYHVIKGKQSLSKAGSEKVLGMLGLTPTFPAMDDYISMSHDGPMSDNVVLKCLVLNSAGDIVAQGIGARSLKKDEDDLNKTLKMAAKSAQIDATLRCAGLSELFTQDLEDIPPEKIGDSPQGDTPQSDSSGIEREMASTKENGYCWFCDQKRHIQKGDTIVLAKISGKEGSVWGAKECYLKMNLKRSKPEDNDSPVDQQIAEWEDMRFPGSDTDSKVAGEIEAARKEHAGNADLSKCSKIAQDNYLEWLKED